MRMPPLIATCLAAVLLAPAPVWADKTYGLVIGIDEYAHISDLHGAENDARDIADALTGLGAEVTMLLNEEASRSRVLEKWRSMAIGLGPGDQLIVSYAGHGSHEPEHYKGSEADGRDETLLLSGFSPYGSAAAERIRDDEIAELLALAAGRTIFIADACHSGTVSRTLNPTLGYRYVEVDGIVQDPLPPPPPPSNGAEDGNAAAALFLAAGADSEKTPEFLIDGKPRGALSYAFARSLRETAADANGDRVLSKGEIEGFVRKIVRDVSRGVQRPQVSPAGGAEVGLIALGASAAPPAAQDPLARAFDHLPRPAVHFTQSASAIPGGIRLVADRQSAEFVVDLSAGKVFSMVGDTLRDLPDRARDAEVQRTIDTLRLVAALRGMPSALDVAFAGGDKLYDEAERVTVQIRGRARQSLILLNIAANGEIAFLYPRHDLGDPATLAPHDKLNLSLQVQAPFGADHIIAIEVAGDPQTLISGLSGFHGSHEIPDFWEVLRLGVPPDTRFAIFPFHTRAGRDG